MGYITLFGLGIIVFGRDDGSWKALLTVHVALLCGSAWIIVNWHDRVQGLSGFLRQLYPPLLYILFYSETRVAIHWINPGFQDAQLLTFERMIFGADLNIWLIPFQKALINEWMMIGYFSYYLLVPLVALPLFLRNRIKELNGFLTAATTTFVISYLGFILYPVEGPRYFLADHLTEPLSGFVFVPLVRWIIENGAIHGGCMPSSHVAVAWVALVWAYRTQRSLAIVLTPLVGTLFIATVWGRFHYVSDVAVGWPVGILGLWLAARLKTAPDSHGTSIRFGRQVRHNRVAKTMGEAE
jgi:hypothetical protein